MDDRMIPILEFDFDVRLLTKKSKSCLLFGIRKNHVHFIKNLTEPYNRIVQFHVLKHKLVQCFETLIASDKATSERPLMFLISPSFSVSKHFSEEYELIFGKDHYLLDKTESDSLIQLIMKDIRIIKRARKLLFWQDNRWSLEKFLTLKGNTIEYEVQDSYVIEAAAFELLKHRSIKKPPSLGIYTMVSHLIDGTYDIDELLLKKFSKGLQNFYTVASQMDYLDLLLKHSFSIPILEEKHDERKIFNQIKKSYYNLTPPQKVQLKILNPNSGISFLLSLGLILEVIHLFEFNNLINVHLQPDSKIEQNNRYETCLVMAFGELFKTTE